MFSTFSMKTTSLFLEVVNKIAAFQIYDLTMIFFLRIFPATPLVLSSC